VLDPQNATARKTRASEAEGAVNGRQLYDDLDTAKAAVSFTEAVKAHKQSDLTGTSDSRPPGDARLAGGERRDRAAQNDIDKLVSLTPPSQVRELPPDSLKQVEDVASRRRAERDRGEDHLCRFGST
jgi:DNA polymerase/3'-5' exonuclease PolX